MYYYYKKKFFKLDKLIVPSPHSKKQFDHYPLVRALVITHDDGVCRESDHDYWYMILVLISSLISHGFNRISYVRAWRGYKSPFRIYIMGIKIFFGFFRIFFIDVNYTTGTSSCFYLQFLFQHSQRHENQVAW